MGNAPPWIILLLLGPTKWAEKNSKSVSEAFFLFFRRTMIDTICKWTNQEGKRKMGRLWKDMTRDEMTKYIGQLILMGVFKSKNEDVTELYSTKTGRPIFSRVMSRDRFKEITSALRFDDAEKRRRRPSSDKLEPIREIFQNWNKSLREVFVLGWSVTVDEQLVTFRGRCPFRQYIPSKPGKYGFKFWLAADSSTGYVWKAEVYIGKEDGQAREVGQGERVVKELLTEIYHSGRNVTCDNFFVSLPLARFLLKKKITLVGTIRKNKKELPTEREVFSTLFGFQDDCMILSYCPKKHKVVTLLSTMHNETTVEGAKKKPTVITTYNETKAGVDKADQKLRHFSVKRKTRRWPVVVFSNMIDISALNSFIIFISQNPEAFGTKSGKRRKYLIRLGMELAGISDEEAEQIPPAPSLDAQSPSLRKRCHICPRKDNRSTKTCCQQCKKNVCVKHYCVLCYKCSM